MAIFLIFKGKYIAWIPSVHSKNLVCHHHEFAHGWMKRPESSTKSDSLSKTIKVCIEHPIALILLWKYDEPRTCVPLYSEWGENFILIFSHCLLNIFGGAERETGPQCTLGRSRHQQQTPPPFYSFFPWTMRLVQSRPLFSILSSCLSLVPARQEKNTYCFRHGIQNSK